MATFNLGKVFKNIEQIVKEATNGQVLAEIGKTTTERIQKRTRVGRGVKENLGKSHKLPKLAKTTKKERKRLKGKGLLTGPGATPAKSGLNRSGQMLNDMTYKVVGNKVEVKLDTQGAKKATTVIKNNPNFEFMNISNVEFKALVKIVEEAIVKAIRKLT